MLLFCFFSSCALLQIPIFTSNDFIQLPPIKKDTPSEVVSMIWQYLKLPEESRKRVKAELINVHENCGKEDFQIPNLYDIVPKEEIAEFEDIMRKIKQELFMSLVV